MVTDGKFGCVWAAAVNINNNGKITMKKSMSKKLKSLFRKVRARNEKAMESRDRNGKGFRA